MPDKALLRPSRDKVLNAVCECFLRKPFWWSEDNSRSLLMFEIPIYDVLTKKKFYSLLGDWASLIEYDRRSGTVFQTGQFTIYAQWEILVLTKWTSMNAQWVTCMWLFVVLGITIKLVVRLYLQVRAIASRERLRLRRSLYRKYLFLLNTLYRRRIFTKDSLAFYPSEAAFRFVGRRLHAA